MAGRTETIRGVSDESVAFCRAFTEHWSTMSADEKFKLLKAATECHSKKSRAAAEGKGVDRYDASASIRRISSCH